MSIWNKILTGLIFVALLVFFYMALRTLKTHQYWREMAGRLEQKVKKADEEQRRLQAELAEVQLSLVNRVNDRGRAWYHCTPQQAAPQTGQVRLRVDQPDPNGITDKMVMFAFAEADVDQANVDRGGQYLGEFQVEAIVGNQEITLRPSRPLSPRELQRLSDSVQRKVPWTLYERMPFDNHDVLAELSEAEKKALLPADRLTEYLKDGEPATWEQLDQWKVAGTLVDENGQPLVDEKGNRMAGAKGFYRRPLRDYKMLFDAYDYRRTVLVDLLASAQRDGKLVADALADANQDIAFQDQQATAAKADLAKVRGERDAVAAHLTAVKQKAAELKAYVDRLIETNKTVAAEIAKIQWEATRRIDERTRTMAQSAEGKK